MNIICFGDSVTRGVTHVRGRLRIVKENYPTLLQSALTEMRVNMEIQMNIVNKGVINDNSDLLLARLDKDVLSERPNYVVIEIGGNDCNFRWDEVAKHPHRTHDSIVPIERYLRNIEQMVKQIQNIGSTPVILDILPLDPARYYQHISSIHGASIGHWIGLCGGIGHWHGLYNYELRNLLKKLQVKRIDVRSAFKRAGNLSELLSDDGVHPSPAGYRVLANSVLSGLLEMGIIKPVQKQKVSIQF